MGRWSMRRLHAMLSTSSTRYPSRATAWENEAHVITSTGLYYIMARDIIVDNSDLNSATGISASSRAVIHLIDKALKFE